MAKCRWLQIPSPEAGFGWALDRQGSPSKYLRPSERNLPSTDRAAAYRKHILAAAIKCDLISKRQGGSLQRA